MKIKPGYVLRNIADENVVIPVGNAFADNRVMLTLNDTAAFLWSKLSVETTIDELVSAMCEEYDISAENATADISAFCKELMERNMLGE